jgi:hypothetical protein
MIRLLLLVLVSRMVWAAPVVVKDLRPDWQQYSTDGYVPVVGISADLHTVYFPVRASLYKGQYLSVISSEECNLFVNGKLLVSGKHLHLSLDSLSARYADELFFGVHGETSFGDVTTKIVSPLAPESTDQDIRRPPTFFRDYAIIASAILLLFFLILFKTNPQLTFDYFSFAKIFSVQERNENLLASRITSSENLLFYIFCALLTGFLLSAILYLAGPHFHVERFYGIASLGGAFGAWLRLSLFVLALLAAKLIIVLTFSSLFSFRETISFQFFNFLRFVLFIAVVMAILSLLFFVFKGDQPLFYERLMILALVLLSVGSVMVLIKLLARSPFSFFHLFSYLCASEIIPLVIIIKIFF